MRHDVLAAQAREEDLEPHYRIAHRFQCLMLKTRLSLCAQVIDWCFCARVFSCPVGKACLVLFRKDGVIVTRCRLFGGGPPRGGPPRTNTP